MPTLHEALLQHNINNNGGVYKNGKPLGLIKKLEVVAVFQKLEQENGENNNNKVSCRQLAKAAKISKSTANKIMQEIIVDDLTTYQRKGREEKRDVVGPGSYCLNKVDEAILLHLRNKNPTRSLKSYRKYLYQYTGTLVSKTIICVIYRYGSNQQLTMTIKLAAMELRKTSETTIW